MPQHRLSRLRRSVAATLLPHCCRLLLPLLPSLRQRRCRRRRRDAASPAATPPPQCYCRRRHQLVVASTADATMPPPPPILRRRRLHRSDVGSPHPGSHNWAAAWLPMPPSPSGRRRAIVVVQCRRDATSVASVAASPRCRRIAAILPAFAIAATGRCRRRHYRHRAAVVIAATGRHWRSCCCGVTAPSPLPLIASLAAVAAWQQPGRKHHRHHQAAADAVTLPPPPTPPGRDNAVAAAPIVAANSSRRCDAMSLTSLSLRRNVADVAVAAARHRRHRQPIAAWRCCSNAAAMP
jgi:hypothetical protein